MSFAFASSGSDFDKYMKERRRISNLIKPNQCVNCKKVGVIVPYQQPPSKYVDPSTGLDNCGYIPEAWYDLCRLCGHKQLQKQEHSYTMADGSKITIESLLDNVKAKSPIDTHQ